MVITKLAARNLTRRPVLLLGEHNAYVFGELLGMSKEEIQSLADDQINGTVPLDM